MKLEILDEKGNLVRRFASDDPLKPTAEELARELIPTYWIARPTTLPANRGPHRWIWNLHYPDPDTTIRGYPISAVPHATSQGPQGPTALPGTYLVRLTINGTRLEAPLILKPDPRVTTPASALEQQFQLASRLSGLLSESSRAVLTAQSEHSQLQALTGNEPKDPGIVSFETQLTDLQGPLTELQEQIDTLYKQVVQADAAPTTTQLQATAGAETKLTPLLETWKQLQTQLPGVNKALRAARLGALRPDLPPPHDRNMADEE